MDTGGTFTDLLLLMDGELTALKVPSTPDDPARAILEGVRVLLGGPGEEDGSMGGAIAGGAIAGGPAEAGGAAGGVAAPPFHLVHGSTVATNALLEGKGARVFLITNRGFEDVLEIGRQNRPQLYALVGHRAPPLVPAADRLGITGRIDFAGEEHTPLDMAEVAALPRKIREAEAVAVVLLHSYANPAHEEAVGEALRGLGIPVSLSSRILPEFREFERTSTTVANACVAPRMAKYLGALEASCDGAGIRIMGSSGGALSLRRAMAEPVHTVLSGPAGGVVGALEWGKRCGLENLLSFDMGGTSTDVALLPGRLLHTSEGKIGELPLAISLLDIHTVGAGGGSVARIDPGGALRVGPESAGAHPGPICYGQGGREVTVTDANLWLGRLSPDGLLGGESSLDRGAVAAPIRALAAEAGVSVDEVAEGILEVVNTAMEGALRVISIERGVDPEDFHLVSFGGAGGVHAAELAERIGARGVLIPPDPGLLSAFGMLVAPIARDRSRTVFLSEDRGGGEEVEREFEGLMSEALEEMVADDVPREMVTLTRWVDARYEDQSFEIRVPADNWAEGFHRAHEERFGYRRKGVALIAVTLRVRAEAPGRGPSAGAVRLRSKGAVPREPREERRISVGWRGERIEARLLEREELPVGEGVEGPALLTEYSSTTWCPPGWSLRVREGGVLELQKNRRDEGG